VSRLRARCPACRTLTAVALGPAYECHACGHVFPAGLVRVPRAWGEGGEAMAEAARLELPYPEAAVVELDTLAEQTDVLAAGLPERPLILGGCCCAHVGAIRGLARRGRRLGVVWLDAHGDLNTPETSPSGNAWGMPLRMLLDAGDVAPRDVALVGARALDPSEDAFLAVSEVRLGPEGVADALRDVDAAYVALDIDVLEPGLVACFMPEPGGLDLDETEAALLDTASRAPLAGMGLTGLVPDPASLPALRRLLAAAGL
jgi:arginase